MVTWRRWRGPEGRGVAIRARRVQHGGMAETASPTERPTPAQLRDLAVDLATSAAALVRKERNFVSQHGSLAQITSTKSSPVDPVTAVDKASEAHIVDRLAALRPGDGILGEEGANVEGVTGVTWVVDPIDGTVNFIYGLPMYAVSVGAALDGELVAGAVVNVASGDVYRAAFGEGAWVTRGGEKKRLRASRAEETSTALVATGFSYNSQWRAAQAEILHRVLPRVRDIRRMGSAALDLCQLAEGRVDAYYEHGTHPWDYAAGAIIASEAGATVRHPGLADRGGDGALVAASGARLWGDFSDLLAGSGALRDLGAG